MSEQKEFTITLDIAIVAGSEMEAFQKLGEIMVGQEYWAGEIHVEN